MPEHFASAPGWEWWILGYFFLAGVSGGAYTIGTMLRLWGTPQDLPAARTAFLVAFPALVLCPIFLTVDLGQPFRFWHMLIDTSTGGLAFKFWSPMSVGSWVLAAFGLFAFVSFAEALGVPVVRQALPGIAGRIWNLIGTVLGLFISGYTGVLLAVSNQPVWSDGWPLGGMFLASGLAAGAAVVLLVLRSRRADDATVETIAEADRNFAILEVALIALFLGTVALNGAIVRMLGLYLILWVVVAAGLVAPFLAHGRTTGALRLAAIVSLLGVLALRAVVIFSAQT